MKLCVTCGQEPARAGQKNGRRCHRLYMKRWRAAQAVLRGTMGRGSEARIAKARRRLLRPLEERVRFVAAMRIANHIFQAEGDSLKEAVGRLMDAVHEGLKP